MWLQTKIDQLGILRIVVMGLSFDPRIGQMVDLNL